MLLYVAGTSMVTLQTKGLKIIDSSVETSHSCSLTWTTERVHASSTMMRGCTPASSLFFFKKFSLSFHFPCTPVRPRICT